MPKLRDGAHDLGLVTDWQFVFLKPGTSLETTMGVVYLDVGGKLAPGVMDQHSDQTLGDSTGQLIERFPEHVHGHLLGPWLKRRDDGQDLKGRTWRPRIATHIEPDFDAAVSALLVMELIEHGELPSWAPALIAYAAQVDQGRYRMELGDGTPPDDVVRAELAPVHLAFLALQHIDVPPEKRGMRDQHRLTRGLELIRAEVASVCAAAREPWKLDARSFWPEQHAAEGTAAATAAKGVGGWRKDARFADLAQLLDEDWPRHQADWARAERRQVEVPAVGSRDPLAVDGVIMREPPEAVLHKYWCRGRRFPFTLTPMRDGYRGGRRDEVGGKVRFPVVITSVDSDWRDNSGQRICLAGLGARLEQRECAWRADVSGGDTRGKTPRWPDVTNADPWYDGRGHGYGIVDVPNSGTHLPLETIIQVATEERYWEMPVEAEAELLIVERAVSLKLESLPTAKAVLRPQSSTGTIASWFKESREVELTSGLALPRGAGLIHGTRRVRMFPRDTCGPMVIHRWTAPKGTTLEQLAEAAAGRRKQAEDQGAPPPVVLLRYRLVSPPPDVKLLEERIVGCPLVPLAGDERHPLLIGDRGAVLRDDGTGADRLGAIVESFVYAHFIRETLSEYSKKIVEVLNSTESTKTDTALGASDVQSRFLRFQAQHYQLDISHDAEAQAVFSQLRARLEILPYYSEVSEELERLAEYEAQRAANALQKAQEEARKAEALLNRLMAIISVTGVVETIAALVSLNYGASWWPRDLPTRDWLVVLLVLGGPTMLIVGLITHLMRRAGRAS